MFVCMLCYVCMYVCMLCMYAMYVCMLCLYLNVCFRLVRSPSWARFCSRAQVRFDFFLYSISLCWCVCVFICVCVCFVILDDAVGSIPSEVGHLSNLEYFRVSQNEITGTNEISEVPRLIARVGLTQYHSYPRCRERQCGTCNHVYRLNIWDARFWLLIN